MQSTLNILEQLNDPRYRWINDFRRYHVREIRGGIGSGKTAKLAFLAVLDVMESHRVAMIDPMRHQTFEGLETFGAGLNLRDGDRSAEAGIRLFLDEVQQRLHHLEEQSQPLEGWSFFADQMSSWASDMSAKIMTDFMLTCIRHLKRANMFWTYVVYGEANKLEFQQSVAQLETIAVRDPSVPSGIRCSGKAILRLPSQKPCEVEIPAWMREPSGYDYRPLIEAIRGNGQ